MVLTLREAARRQSCVIPDEPAGRSYVGEQKALAAAAISLLVLALITVIGHVLWVIVASILNQSLI